MKAAGLVETLQGAGPFTVFAPTNEAFAALPAGTVDTLLKPGNKSKLVAVLTYHVLPGKYSAADIEADIKKMNGKAEYKTVEGDSLSFSDKYGAVWVMDASGNTAKVTIADVNQSNGVIHVIDKVLIPKMQRRANRRGVPTLIGAPSGGDISVQTRRAAPLRLPDSHPARRRLHIQDRPDTIDYVATEPAGLTATTSRTVTIEALASSPPPSVASSSSAAVASSTAQ